ncbi:MAG: HD domain-containing protein [Rubripirellula sp.]
MSDLQRAIEIAVDAHRGQTRKDGSPYVLHPLRLMMAVDSIEQKIVAVLHDVVEDTEVTMEEVRAEGFSQDVLAALRLVTHVEGVSYEDYINRIKPNPIARAVKLADLKDNSNLFEIPEVKQKDLERMGKYHRAYKTLSEAPV